MKVSVCRRGMVCGLRVLDFRSVPEGRESDRLMMLLMYVEKPNVYKKVHSASC